MKIGERLNLFRGNRRGSMEKLSADFFKCSTELAVNNLLSLHGGGDPCVDH